MGSIMCVEARRLEAHARRAARRAGLIARKSHKRAGVPNVNNWGQFMLVDHERNLVVAGLNFDVSAEEVVELCEVVDQELKQASGGGLSLRRSDTSDPSSTRIIRATPPCELQGRHVPLPVPKVPIRDRRRGSESAYLEGRGLPRWTFRSTSAKLVTSAVPGHRRPTETRRARQERAHSPGERRPRPRRPASAAAHPGTARPFGPGDSRTPRRRADLRPSAE